MNIRLLESSAELEKYDAWVKDHKEGNVWQSLAWKTYQEVLGRKTRLYAAISRDHQIEVTALVVIDTTVGGFSVWDIPRGPLVSDQWKVDTDQYAAFLKQIIDDAKENRCFALYVSPLSLSTFHYPLSTRHVQPEATRIIDLTKSENDILAQMHPKGRYNIALAKKHGIEVTEGSKDDIDNFYELLVSTGHRDGFRISQKSHYARFLSDLKGSFLLMGKYKGRPIASLLGLVWPSTQEMRRGEDAGLAGPASGATPLREGWAHGRDTVGGPSAMYYYGASSYEHRNLMAPYLLQWEAMRRAKAQGCLRYDLLGISPDKALPDDPWWGITDFKRKFGGAVIGYPQEQMIVLKPLVKWALEMKRKIVG